MRNENLFTYKSAGVRIPSELHEIRHNALKKAVDVIRIWTRPTESIPFGCEKL